MAHISNIVHSISTHLRLGLAWTVSWLASIYRQLLATLNSSITYSRTSTPPPPSAPVCALALKAADTSLLKSKAPLPQAKLLDQPPDFDYEQFIDLMLPSEKKLRTIFPNDHETRTKFMDLQAETQLLDMYKLWAFHKKWDSTDDKRDHTFYKQLFLELSIDYVTVKLEFEKVEISRLALWELLWLDNEGTTKDVEAYLSLGQNPFRNGFVEATEAKEKYGYLVPLFFRGGGELSTLINNGSNPNVDQQSTRARLVYAVL